MFRRGGRSRGVQGIELGNRVVANRVDFCWGKTLAFLGDDMQELRALEVTHVAQRGDQGGQVVTVDRADVIPAQLFEQGAGNQHALGVFFGTTGNFHAPGRRESTFLLPSRMLA